VPTLLVLELSADQAGSFRFAAMFDFDDLPEVSAAEHEEDLAKQYELERAVISVGPSPRTLAKTWNGDMKAAVCRRPLALAKAPIAVLMLPGNPCIGGYHAELPLPLAVDECLCKEGFPVVRFDWNGTGMNFAGIQKPTQDEAITGIEARAMFEIATHLGERVCLVPWNYSGPMAGAMCAREHPAFLPKACALISLSFGYGQWEFVSRFVGQEAGDGLKEAFEFHRAVDVPTLYVFGSKDTFTPEQDVQRIINTRKDQGKGATLKVIDQSEQQMHGPEYFMMTGKEMEVGKACAEWLKGVRRDIVEANSIDA